MSSLTIETRELRSFRLYQRTSDIRSFLNKKETFGIFMMCNALQPKEREELRALLLPHKLKMQYIPNKIAHFVLAKKIQEVSSDQKQNWEAINNLLEGNVILITDEMGGMLGEDRLNFLLSQQTFLFVRFLFVNGQIYRNRDLRVLLNMSSQEKFLGNKLIPSLLMGVLFRRVALLLAIKEKADKQKTEKQ